MTPGESVGDCIVAFGDQKGTALGQCAGEWLVCLDMTLGESVGELLGGQEGITVGELAGESAR